MKVLVGKGCVAIQFFGDNDSETVETACIILYMEKVLNFPDVRPPTYAQQGHPTTVFC